MAQARTRGRAGPPQDSGVQRTDAAREALTAGGLFDGAVDALLPALTTVRLAAGERLFDEGDAATALFVVVDGAVQVVGAGSDGRELILRRLGPGTVFGEAAVLPGARRRTAGVRGLEATTLLRLDRADFHASLAETDAVTRRLQAIGAENLREQLARQSRLLGAIAAHHDVRELTLGAGEVLFEEGDVAERIYLVLSGTAGVYRQRGGRAVLLGRVHEGRCIGELALLYNARRSATVVAETDLRLFELDGARFVELLGGSPELQEQILALERVYQLPARGFVTQHRGTVAGADALTTVYHLADGRRFAASRVPSGDLYHLSRLEPPAGTPATVLTYASAQLELDAEGRIVSIMAGGDWPELPGAHLLAIDGATITLDQQHAFTAGGGLPCTHATGAPEAEAEDPDAVLCTCVHVRNGAVDAAIAEGCASIDELQRTLSCGTVCGRCIPRLAERLGESAWTPVEIAQEIHLTPHVRAFRLVPSAGGRVHPWVPGQHVVISARIAGRWVERQYTLSNAAGEGVYEITVKREPEGLFSRWLFDERTQADALRVSRPQGATLWQASDDHALLCFVAGIGVTPAIAACRAGSGTIHVDYSGRTAGELAYVEQLRASGATVVIRETARDGRISAQDVRTLIALHPGSHAFVCGPDGFLLDVAGHLRDAGVPAERIHVEVFTHAGLPVPQPADAEAIAQAATMDYLFSTPVPDTPPRWLRAVTAAGRTVHDVANAGALDRGPGGWLTGRLGAGIGLDPALPRDHLGPVSGLARGPRDANVVAAERVSARFGENKRRARAGERLAPDTPDGDTWTYWVPNAPLATFEGPLAVATGWTKMAERGWAIPVVVTRSPHVMAALLDDPEVADRGAMPYHYVAQLLGSSTLVPDHCRKATGLFAGPMKDNRTWTEDRAVATEVFGAGMLELLAPAMETSMQAIAAQIDARLDREPDAVLDAHDLMMRVAYDMVVRSSFGNADIAELHAIGDRMRPPLHDGLATLYKLTNGRQSLAGEFLRQAGEVRSEFAKIVSIIRRLDAEDALTEAQRASPIVDLIVGGALDDGRIYTLLVPIVVGGHETTAHTLSWALYELGRNPALRGFVVDEIDGFRAANRGRTIDPSQYDERPWMQALLYEIWRRYAPVPAAARMTLRAGVVPPDPQTGIGGFRYRKGTLVIGAWVATQLDPDRFPRPYDFRPERFLEGASAWMSPRERGRLVRENLRAREEAHELLTFGTGPGRCVGKAFNLLESFVVLDGILGRYEFELADPHRDVSSSDSVLSGPEPGRIGIRLRRRDDACSLNSAVRCEKRVASVQAI